jgi:tetratricopeptide (TPR) repeat protein
MLLVQCASCAAPLGLSLGKKCGRCSTRYCGPVCQKKHWEEGGHDKLCRKIKKAGGAEQYNANQKYTEAVAAAAKKCADDTKGQTCYICTQALHWKTKEGLVRMCACRGTAGFAHVSCLAEQAKILVAEALENNSDDSQAHRWHRCSLCEQHYHGVVACALGWACWKTYLVQPEEHWSRLLAIRIVANGLGRAKRHEDALTVRETELAMGRRYGASEEHVLITQSNLASTYQFLGRREEALSLRREVYSGRVNLVGEDHGDTLGAAVNYASTLFALEHFAEAKALLRQTVPVAQRVLGENHEITLKMRNVYAQTLYADAAATLDDLREALTTLEDVERIARRVLGGSHPFVVDSERCLRGLRAALDAHEASEPGDVNSMCAAVEAMARKE